MSKKILNIFETFSGISAQHKALNNLKEKKHNIFFKIIATCEWDIFANIAYNAIHGSGLNVNSNISTNDMINYLNQFSHSHNSKTLVNFKKYSKNLIKNNQLNLLYNAYINHNNFGSILDVKVEELLKKSEDIDLITYSFPCQDLSIAGSIHGKPKGMKKNSGSRSSLLWQIEKILNDLEKYNKLPKFLLLENVRNILGKDNIKDYQLWLKFLKTKGYSTKTYDLNARNFNIPQERKRVYSISILNYDKPELVDENGEIIQYISDSRLDIKKTKQYSDYLAENIRDFLIESVEVKFLLEALDAQPRDTISRKLIYQKNYILNNIKANNFKNYSRTITTKQDRHPNAGIIEFDYFENSSILNTHFNRINTFFKEYYNLNKILEAKTSKYRFLTPRETYKLMGFTDNDFDKVFKCNITKERLYRQAGNSIVVNVLESIFEIIFCFWNKEGDN